MDKVILIEFKMKDDDYVEKVAVALNKEIAEKHIEKLKNEYQYLYTNGRFYLSELGVINE